MYLCTKIISMECYKVYIKQDKSGASVVETIEDFGLYCVDIPFKPAGDVKDIVSRDWKDENGVDESVRLRNPGTVILNGHCDATITCDGYAVTNVYVRHKSKLSIVCRGLANVRVNVLDDACVTVNSESPAKAFVYHYSGDVKASGNAVVRDRQSFKFS